MTSHEAYTHCTPEVFAKGGAVSDEGTGAFLRAFMQELHDRLVHVLTVLPRG